MALTEGPRSFGVHSFANLIHSDYRIPSCDYADLLRATALLTRKAGEVLKAYRRMVFNVLAHNRDDPPKNFAFLLDDRSRNWILSPAFDLTWSAGPGGEHAMTVGGEGKVPGRPHFLRLAAERDVPANDAAAILEQVRAAVARWPEFAWMAGVPRSKAQEVGRTLAG